MILTNGLQHLIARQVYVRLYILWLLLSWIGIRIASSLLRLFIGTSAFGRALTFLWRVSEESWLETVLQGKLLFLKSFLVSFWSLHIVVQSLNCWVRIIAIFSVCLIQLHARGENLTQGRGRFLRLLHTKRFDVRSWLKSLLLLCFAIFISYVSHFIFDPFHLWASFSGFLSS